MQKFCYAITFMLLIVLFSLQTIAAEPNGQKTNSQSVNKTPLKIGLTPALLHYRHALNDNWKDYLQKKLHRPVIFVQRDSYRETMDLLTQGKLDAAWICSYPYVSLESHVKLLATPVYQGKSIYYSYIIVPADNKQAQSIMDLEHSVFAYADPYSNSGYIAPRFLIRNQGKDPDHFFKKTFFTLSHRKVIQAVAQKLANGGAVDSYIWESLNLIDPQLTEQTRIISRSEPYGFSPIVTKQSISSEDFKQLQRIFLEMDQDPQGQQILQQLNLDSFIVGHPDDYQSIRKMMNGMKQ